MRSAASAATISDSDVECETAVCFLEIPQSGKLVFGPSTFSEIPDVEREAFSVPAKSASLYNPRTSLSRLSPTHPTIRSFNVEFM